MFKEGEYMTESIIISTQNCYMGYSDEEEATISGTYEELIEANVIEESIEWDHVAWEMEKNILWNIY